MTLDNGWVIGVFRIDGQSTTEQEEREAMEAVGIQPEEQLIGGGWIAAIPVDWVPDLNDPESVDAADHDIEVNGVQWRIEIPTP